MANPAPIPWAASVIQLGPNAKPLPTYTLSKEFGQWLQLSLVAQVAAAPQVFPSVALTTQSAAIGTTSMPLPALATGTYRVSYYCAITVADAVSSSLTVTISWIESTQTKSLSGVPITGNTITTVQSSTALIVVDASSPITYSTAYASNTPGAMKYRITVVLEAL